MPSRLFLSIVALSILLNIACKKDSSTAACESLKQAMINDDVIEAKAAIILFINQLANKDYTAENLARLCALISGQCNANAQVWCFDCIDTLPSQSEIGVSLTASGTTITRTIDISYSPDNKMTVLNMH